MSQHGLPKELVERYSRQLLVPGFGVKGQQGLVGGSVLIVGAGGLGCPAGMYLAGAGVGRVGFVDYDTVELTNLHRQVLHTEQRVGVSKAESACAALRSLNSHVQCVPHQCKLSRENAVQLVRQYDVILDASDNAVTRYLINDACIIAQKPLVSGAALRWEGQLTTFNFGSGPCYRCLYPTPPPPSTITNCDAGGVLGAVTGVIGSLQALEAIRILSKQQQPLYAGKLLLFDGQTGEFRSCTVRSKSADCLCARPESATLADSYELFCGSSATDKTPSTTLLAPSERITCSEYAEGHRTGRPCGLLIDVRPASQYEICCIPGSLNIPFHDLDLHTDSILARLDNDASRPIVAICRRGNQSQQAVLKLRALGFTDVKDIVGGMRSWATDVDPSCPIY